MIRYLMTACAISMCFSSACTRIGVKSEMFSGAPIWETKQVTALHGTRHDARTTAKVSDLKLIEAETLVADSPGLALLASQVLVKDSMGKDEKAFSSEKIKTGVSAKNFFTDLPLSAELASDPTTRAIVSTMVVVHSEANGVHAELPNETLSPAQIEDFTKKALRHAYGLFGPTEDNKNSHIEDRSLRLKEAVEQDKITFDRVLWEYLKAYYNGSFVDRTGSIIKKPKIGLTITNESITGFLTVFLEALHDFAITNSTKLKVPVLYAKSAGQIVWANAHEAKPTFAGLFKDIEHSSPNIEMLQTDYDKEGITREKLEYINYASGLAGESSQALSGTLVRAIGGANLGFVFMGKFSFGDNETLSKIIDTLVEVNVRRSTATATSSILYSVKLPAGTPIPNK